MKSPITTHVLDLSLGRPAPGITVRLERRRSDSAMELLAQGATNADGRVSDLLPPGAVETGTYRITFELESYFKSGARKSFYPEASIVFVVESTTEHYHVPLLLSPFGYSTYRGS